MVTMIMK